EHKGKFALGAEDAPWALFGFLQTKGRYQFVPRDGDIDLAKIAFEKPGVKRIELFGLGGKCKTVLEIVDSSYLGHRH
ncbi:hypothetical protein, partial [Arenibacter certesii]|uniref:hypothetical protein n=1 Tax=Arenibacter certesii TaxID=228955 RepID=UPI00047DEA0C